ncbi:hypothetical protein MHY87_08835 [Microvirga sp. ACRRW]|uniref:hypothetical protein n=1 Tax=Microvirga sp. ACRRW TaxID=2918205 RepID=UPI001EF5EFCC|nr:hypothetical protein [Microvirga sp. ACRRW]MCG7393007.1 hypothetical protein [Microvirga sp. ACRRW]
MRTALAILIACAAFAASLICLVVLDETFGSGEIEASIVAAVLAALLAPSFLVIAAGVIAAPKAGLRSHVLDSVRGNVPHIAGKWASTAFIGFSACLLAVLVSATIRFLSPVSFTAEYQWRDLTMTDGVELVAEFFIAAIFCWVGLLSILAWICLKIFGTARRTFALAVAIAVLEGLGLGLVALVSLYLDYPLDLAVMAESLAWCIATVTCAWLYVTRTLEHGLLALAWFPALILTLQPLWVYLGV